MEAARLDLYEVLLEENDQDLYPWISGQTAPPERLAPLLAEIGTFARARLSPTV
jgi:antitoxin CptB